MVSSPVKRFARLPFTKEIAMEEFIHNCYLTFAYTFLIKTMAMKPINHTILTKYNNCKPKCWQNYFSNSSFEQKVLVLQFFSVAEHQTKIRWMKIGVSIFFTFLNAKSSSVLQYYARKSKHRQTRENVLYLDIYRSIVINNIFELIKNNLHSF